MLKSWPFILIIMFLLQSCAESASADGTSETGERQVAETIVEVDTRLSMSGYQRVFIPLAEGRTVADVAEVMVGSHLGLVMESEDGGFSVLDQGCPEPGFVDVTVDYLDGETEVLEDAFEYRPPTIEPVRTMMAVGASLGQGVQRGVPTHHGVLMSPPAQLARALGVYMPLPLLVDGLFAQIGPLDIEEPPRCEAPPILEFLADSLGDMLLMLQDPESGEILSARALLDATVDVKNVCVGNSRVADILYGPKAIEAQMVAHLVYATEGSFFSPVNDSQLDLVDRYQPDIVVSVDLLGNDLIGPIVGGDMPDPAGIRPAVEVEPEIHDIVQRLALASPHVFLGDMPPPSLLPIATIKRHEQINAARDLATSEGEDPDVAAQEANAAALEALAEIDAIAQAYNAILEDAASAYDHVVVVPLSARVAELEAFGLQLEGHELDVGKFGGLLGLDGVHFTDTGYGELANTLLQTIDAYFETSTTDIDLKALADQDEESPTALKEAGLPVDECVLEEPNP